MPVVQERTRKRKTKEKKSAQRVLRFGLGLGKFIRIKIIKTNFNRVQKLQVRHGAF